MPFSAWHVLSHTSGFGDIDLESLLLRGGDRAEMLRLAQAVPQADGAGIGLPLRLDAVRPPRRGRRAAGWADRSTTLVRANVLEPLGMTDTTFDPAAAGAVRHGAGHVDLPVARRRAGRCAARRLHAGCGWRAAGLWSTAADVLRFGRAILPRRRARRRAGPVAGVRGR